MLSVSDTQYFEYLRRFETLFNESNYKQRMALFPSYEILKKQSTTNSRQQAFNFIKGIPDDWKI